MKDQYRQLGKDIFVYGFGLLFSRGFNFFLVPVLTRLFSPSEYGVLEMFITINGMIVMLMTMGLDGAQSYYFMEAKNNDNRSTTEVISSVLHLRLIVGIILVLIVSLLSPFIVAAIFDSPIDFTTLMIVALSALFASLVTQSLEVFRLQYKAWKYVLLSTTQSILGISSILFFVYYLDKKTDGYFMGLICANAIALVFGWIGTRQYEFYKHSSKKIWRDLLKFGVPLIPAGIMIYIMQASDRIFLIKMLGEYELGIYAVGAKFSMMIVFVVEAFRRSFWPQAMEQLHKKGGESFIGRVAFGYLLVGSLAVLVLAFLAPFLVDFIAGDQYAESWRVVPVLCWSSVFYGFYMFSSLGIIYSKKTYWNALSYGLGALLNLVLNYFLILQLGLIGAALATSISLLFSNIMSMWISRSYYKVEWKIGWYILVLVVTWLIIGFLIL